MKIRTIIYGLCASMFLMSCTEDTIDEQYVKLEQVVCSFYSTDNQPLEIKIKTNPAAWEAESNAAWLEVGKNDDGSMLLLVAADNDSEIERTAEVVVTAGEAMQRIRINQLGLNGSINRYCPMPLHQLGSVISPSGKYAGGYEARTGEEGIIYTPVIIDIQTGEEYRAGDFPMSLTDFLQPLLITDDGLLFIDEINSGGQWVIDKDGNHFTTETLPLPEGYRGVPQVQGTSADGSKWVGYATRGDGKYQPLIWIDGEVHELKYPDKNFRDEEFINGIMARGISADGSVIYGTTWDAFDFGMVYWTDINEKARYVGEDVHKVTQHTIEQPDGTTIQQNLADGRICSAELLKISPSGKWIASSYRTEEIADNGNSSSSQVAAFYNTETEKTTIIEDYGESTGLRATDDGIAFIGIGTQGVTNGVVYDLNSSTHMGTMEEWIFNNYSLHVPTCTIDFVNADGNVVFGTYYPEAMTFQSYYIAPSLE